MPWPIVLYESADAAIDVGGGAIPVGALYPAPEWLSRRIGGESFISPKYFRDHAAHRPPLEVILPCGPFVIDSRAMRGGKPYGDGWDVTGEPPRITLSPSISIPDAYHGYIRDGVITDDVEGRTFPSA